ncbi:MAG: hypothetical protein RJQ04_21125 [Longimicrobiales bacterium]
MAAFHLLACAEDPAAPPTPEPPALDCTFPGTEAGADATDAVWTPEGSPYHLRAPTRVDGGTLTLLPGTLVCAAAGGGIELADGHLEAVGSSHRPIRLVAEETDVVWRGIRSVPNRGASATLRHVRLENAIVGMSATGSAGRVRMDSVAFVGTRNALLVRSGTIRDAVLDGRVLHLGPEGPDDHLSLDRVTIHVADDGTGLDISREARLSLSDVRILGGRLGLKVPGLTLHNPELRLDGPLRIRGQTEAAVEAPADVALRIAGADDRIDPDPPGTAVYAVNSGVLEGPLATWPSWTIVGQVGLGDAEIGPGTRLTVEERHRLYVRGRLDLEGSADDPVRLAGPGAVEFRESTVVARLRHVRVSRLSLRVQRGSLQVDSSEFAHSWLWSGGDSALIRDTRWSHGGLELYGRGSRVEGLVMRDTASVLVLEGADHRITRCDLFGTRGIVSAGSGMRIQECNLVDNRNAGVRSTGAPVDARGNWWGDPAGPQGPEGDGVSGRVDVVPFLPSPVGPDLERVAARIVAPAQLEAETGVALRPAAYAVDAAGIPLFTVDVALEVVDPEIAFTTPPLHERLVGRRPGNTAVVARVPGAPADTVHLTVTQGAPAIEWSDVAMDTVLFEGFTGIWGSGPDDVFAVGGSFALRDVDNTTRGRTYHWNGRDWNRARTPSLERVAGGGGTVLAVGRWPLDSGFRTGLRIYRLRPDRSAWDGVATGEGAMPHDVWMAEDGTLYMARDALLRYREGGPIEDLHAPAGCLHVHGRSASEVYATCNGGVVRVQEAGLVPLGNPSATGHDHAVWAGPRWIWSVGEGGLIRRWNGSSWEEMASGTDVDLFSVQGLDDDDVWVSGVEGTLLHYDGTRWRPVWQPSLATPAAVWVAPDAVYFLGARSVGIERERVFLRGARLR